MQRMKCCGKHGNSVIQSSLLPVRVPSAPPLTPLISALCWFTQTCLIIYALHSSVAAFSSRGQIAFACVFCTIPSIPSVSGQYWTPGSSSLDSAGLDYNPELVFFIFKDFKISCFISASLASGLQVQLNFLVHRWRRLWWSCELLPEQSKNKHEKKMRVHTCMCQSVLLIFLSRKASAFGGSIKMEISWTVDHFDWLQRCCMLNLCAECYMFQFCSVFRAK